MHHIARLRIGAPLQASRAVAQGSAPLLLNNIARLNAVMKVPGKLVARFEFANRTDHFHTRRRISRSPQLFALWRILRLPTAGITSAIAATSILT